MEIDCIGHPIRCQPKDPKRAGFRSGVNSIRATSSRQAQAGEGNLTPFFPCSIGQPGVGRHYHIMILGRGSLRMILCRALLISFDINLFSNHNEEHPISAGMALLV